MIAVNWKLVFLEDQNPARKHSRVSMRLLPVLITAVVSAYGSPIELDEERRRNLFAQTTNNLQNHTLQETVKRQDWGIAINALEPNSVHIASDGIYIETGGFLTSEHGLFVPKAGIIVNTDMGSDPQFKALGNSVYWYKAKG